MEERSYESEASKEEGFDPKKDDFEPGVTKVFYEKKSVYMKASSDFLASLSLVSCPAPSLIQRRGGARD